MYEVAIRPIYFFKHEPFIAAILDVRTTRIIDRTVADLIDDGFSPIGHYVARRVQKYEDPRIAPRPELAGRVTSVNAATLGLSDSKNNIPSIDAREVWLEKRAFSACLAHVFRGCDEAIASGLEKTRADLRQGPARLQRISTIVDFLASKQHWACPTVPFKFSPLLDDSSRQLFPSLETTPKPTYVFDQTGSKTDTWHDRGLDQYGPYTAKVFTPNRPRLCVICQKAHKGRVEQFLHKFINGIRLRRHHPLTAAGRSGITLRKDSYGSTPSRTSPMNFSSPMTGRLTPIKKPAVRR